MQRLDLPTEVREEISRTIQTVEEHGAVDKDVATKIVNIIRRHANLELRASWDDVCPCDALNASLAILDDCDRELAQQTAIN